MKTSQYEFDKVLAEKEKAWSSALKDHQTAEAALRDEADVMRASILSLGKQLSEKESAWQEAMRVAQVELNQYRQGEAAPLRGAAHDVQRSLRSASEELSRAEASRFAPAQT